MNFRVIAVAAVAFVGLLPGCQSMEAAGLWSDRTEEMPAFFRYHHKLNESHGHEFRGYDVGKRHYFYK